MSIPIIYLTVKYIFYTTSTRMATINLGFLLPNIIMHEMQFKLQALLNMHSNVFKGVLNNFASLLAPGTDLGFHNLSTNIHRHETNIIITITLNCHHTDNVCWYLTIYLFSTLCLIWFIKCALFFLLFKYTIRIMVTQ